MTVAINTIIMRIVKAMTKVVVVVVVVVVVAMRAPRCLVLTSVFLRFGRFARVPGGWGG